MKVLSKIISIVILAMTLYMTSAFASTKYDGILDNPEWKQMIENVNKFVIPNQMLVDYFTLLVNKDDLKKIATNGELDKEKSKFISENSNEFLKYLYFIIAVHQINTIQPGPTDAQIMYVTGVIKDPYAQAATNGVEYQMEKAFLREMPLYKLWEGWRTDGQLKNIVSEQLDILFTASQKQKN